MSEDPAASEEPPVRPGGGDAWLSTYLAKAFFIAGLGFIAVLALVRGAGILVPLAVALLLWFIINALARMYEGIWRRRFGRLRALSIGLAFLTLLVASVGVAELLVVNVTQISARASDFQKSINILLEKIAELTGLPDDQVVSTALNHLSLDRLLSAIVTGMTGLAGNIGVVFLYVIFLLVEQRYFNAKLRAVVADAGRRQRIRTMLDRIGHDIQSYLWTMFVVSLMTAVLSYIVMRLVGLDSAGFWAFLIFLLNFIPTIGSILATAMPALYALLQFGDFSPFLALLVGVGVVQFIIGNIVQPRMAAQTLNLSQFVVVLSLFVWGALWGIGGLFLGVPLTAIIMLICSNFPQTRPLAILMSQEGKTEAAIEDAPADGV